MESEHLQLYKSLVSEITKGMEQVKQLKVSSSNNEQDRALEMMLSSHEEALLILAGRAPDPPGSSPSVCRAPDPPGSSSTSVCKVTKSKGASSGLLKRKIRADIWRAKLKTYGASSQKEPDDGYGWRKYGQKEMLGSKYPRAYYRCKHRNTQGCLATKIVQRSDDDPTTFDITYQSKHTCQAGALASKPESHTETEESIHARLEP